MAKRRGNHEGSITHLKDGRWQGRLSLRNGKRKAVYGKTRDECRRKLDALKRRIDDGTFSDTDMTVKQYLEKWLEYRALEVKPKTLSDYNYTCKKYIIPKIGKKKLARLSVLDVQDMMQELAGEKGPKIANRGRKVLNNALGQALRWQVIVRNPVDAIKRLKEEKPAMILWDYEEAARFREVARGHELYSFFLLIMSTGMRLSEMLGFRWRDVEGASVHICHTATEVNGKLVFGETTKTDHSNRMVSLPEDVVIALAEHRHAQQARYARLGFTPSHDLVFSSRVGTPLSVSNLRKTYKALQQEARVPHATLHELRHWHASMLIEEGMDIRAIARRLGHADPSITLRIYAHIFNKQSREKAISLDDVLPRVGERAAAYLN